MVIKEENMASKTIGKLEGTITSAELPMISPAAQAVAASGSSKGAPSFVAADPDLVAKEGVAQDSWFVISHLTSGSNRLELLVHYIRLTPPHRDAMIQAMVSVLDPVSGRSLSEEKDYKVSETTFSTASLDVQTPSGGVSGDASAMHVTGRGVSAHPARGGLHIERRSREGGFGNLIILLFRERPATDRIQHGYHRLYHRVTMWRCQPDVMNQELQPIAARRQVTDDEPRILRHTFLGDQIRICSDKRR